MMIIFLKSTKFIVVAAILLCCTLWFLVKSNKLFKHNTSVAAVSNTQPQQVSSNTLSMTPLDKNAPIYVVETEENNCIKFASGHYANNQRIGYWEFYYPNGAMRACGNFTNNLKSGMWKHFYITGQVMSQGYYDKGVMTGMWISYYSNGNKKLQGEYVAGCQVGHWLEFPDENSLNSYWEGSFDITGRFDKTWKYYKQGALAKTVVYSGGNVSQ